MLDRARLLLPSLLLLLLAASASACTKTEGQTSGTTSSASTPSTAAPSASASATTAASTTPSATPTAEASATGAAPSATPSAATTAATAASGAPSAASSGGNAALAAANAACGTKPLPDCPLQGWMKANTNSAIAANDLPALATALDKAAGFAPPGYTNWVSIAKDGAKAAKAGDMTAAKASCRTCHDQYKKSYKADLRGRKI